MSVLIYTDSNNGALTKNAFEAASYGAQVANAKGTSAVAVVTGSVSNIEELGNYGVTKVLHCSDGSLDNFDPQKVAAVVSSAAKQEGSDTIIFSHDFSGTVGALSNALEFILPRLLKGAIVIIDDYNFINQEGCKLAVTEFGLDIKSCFQTQSGQLVYFHN